jgi:hypothetical protein
VNFDRLGVYKINRAFMFLFGEKEQDFKACGTHGSFAQQ